MLFKKESLHTIHHTPQKVKTCISSLYEILILSNTYLFYHFSSGNYSSSLFTITISVWFDIIFTHVRISFRSPFFPFFSLSLSHSNCRAESNRKIPPFSNFPTFRKSRKQKGASDAIFIFTKQDWNPCVNKTLVAILQLLTVHVCSKTVGWMSTYTYWYIF